MKVPIRTGRNSLLIISASCQFPAKRRLVFLLVRGNSTTSVNSYDKPMFGVIFVGFQIARPKVLLTFMSFYAWRLDGVGKFSFDHYLLLLTSFEGFVGLANVGYVNSSLSCILNNTCPPNFSMAASAYHVVNMEDEPESDDLPSYNRMAPHYSNTFLNPYKYLSLLSGTFNLCSGLVRLHLIRFLQLDTIVANTPLLSRTRLTEALDWLKAVEAKWLVVLNDWSSLFLAVTFILAACFNYATFAVLVRRDRRLTTMRQDSPGQQEKVIMNVM
jgi:hypothetical protein